MFVNEYSGGGCYHENEDKAKSEACRFSVIRIAVPFVELASDIEELIK